jgi:ribosomal protein S19E (S16A)
LRDSKAGINRENAMSNQEWWAAERKAAEFWRKVKENQMAEEKHLNSVRGTAANPRMQNFGTPMRRQSFGF